MDRETRINNTDRIIIEKMSGHKVIGRKYTTWKDIIKGVDHDQTTNFVVNEHINISNIVCNNNQVICNNNEVVYI